MIHLMLGLVITGISTATSVQAAEMPVFHRNRIAIEETLTPFDDSRQDAALVADLQRRMETLQKINLVPGPLCIEVTSAASEVCLTRKEMSNTDIPLSYGIPVNAQLLAMGVQKDMTERYLVHFKRNHPNTPTRKDPTEVCSYRWKVSEDGYVREVEFCFPRRDY